MMSDDENIKKNPERFKDAMFLLRASMFPYYINCFKMTKCSSQRETLSMSNIDLQGLKVKIHPHYRSKLDIDKVSR